MRARRYAKPRQARKMFLVICEGETEEAYVKTLARHYRLPITIKTKVCGSAITERLVNQYVKELEAQKGDECRIFYVYDSDVQSVVEKLKALPGELILTNPCIELWFLLHVAACSRSQDSKAVLRTLASSHSAWAAYAKGTLTKEQADTLINNRAIAIARGKRLPWPHNPSSNMWVFIESLEMQKSVESTKKTPSGALKPPFLALETT